MHGFDAQKPEQGIGRVVEDGDQPSENREVDCGRPGQAAREGFRVGYSEVLGVKLTKNHLHDRGEYQGENSSQRDTDRHGHARPAQQGADGFPDQRLSDEADKQAGHRDAQLGTGKHKGRALGDGKGAYRRGVPRRRAGTEPDTVHRHVGELLSDKVAIGRDDHQGDHDAQQ